MELVELQVPPGCSRVSPRGLLSPAVRPDYLDFLKVQISLARGGNEERERVAVEQRQWLLANYDLEHLTC